MVKLWLHEIHLNESTHKHDVPGTSLAYARGITSMLKKLFMDETHWTCWDCSMKKPIVERALHAAMEKERGCYREREGELLPCFRLNMHRGLISFVAKNFHPLINWEAKRQWKNNTSTTCEIHLKLVEIIKVKKPTKTERGKFVHL